MENGYQHGKGRMYFSNGSVFEGYDLIKLVHILKDSMMVLVDSYIIMEIFMKVIL